MQVEVNGTRLWFDADGPGLVVDAAQEILDALPHGAGNLQVIERAGHFPWLDASERYWPVIEIFVLAAGLSRSHGASPARAGDSG